MRCMSNNASARAFINYIMKRASGFDYIMKRAGGIDANIRRVEMPYIPCTNRRVSENDFGRSPSVPPAMRASAYLDASMQMREPV